MRRNFGARCTLLYRLHERRNLSAVSGGSQSRDLDTVSAEEIGWGVGHRAGSGRRATRYGPVSASSSGSVTVLTSTVSSSSLAAISGGISS